MQQEVLYQPFVCDQINHSQLKCNFICVAPIQSQSYFQPLCQICKSENTDPKFRIEKLNQFIQKLHKKLEQPKLSPNLQLPIYCYPLFQSIEQQFKEEQRQIQVILKNLEDLKNQYDESLDKTTEEGHIKKLFTKLQDPKSLNDQRQFLKNLSCDIANDNNSELVFRQDTIKLNVEEINRRIGEKLRILGDKVTELTQQRIEIFGESQIMVDNREPDSFLSAEAVQKVIQFNKLLKSHRLNKNALLESQKKEKNLLLENQKLQFETNLRSEENKSKELIKSAKEQTYREINFLQTEIKDLTKENEKMSETLIAWKRDNEAQQKVVFEGFKQEMEQKVSDFMSTFQNEFEKQTAQISKLNKEISIQNLEKTDYVKIQLNPSTVEGDHITLQNDNITVKQTQTSHCQVVANESFSSGQHLWKVKTLKRESWSKEYWLLIGVHKDSNSKRKHPRGDSGLYGMSISNNLNFWLVNDGTVTAGDCGKINPQDEVEVKLDCDNGTLELSHQIWTYQLNFIPKNTPLYPYFDPYDLNFTIIK